MHLLFAYEWQLFRFFVAPKMVIAFAVGPFSMPTRRGGSENKQCARKETRNGRIPHMILAWPTLLDDHEGRPDVAIAQFNNCSRGIVLRR